MHTAFIAKIDTLIPIVGADRIQTAIVLGEQVVVSKNLEVGYVGVFFPAELQLSDPMCYHNDLYRDPTKNINTEAKGFFSDNRRVRCQPFMKVKSEGYFCDLASLNWTGIDTTKLKVGDQFTELNKHEVCKKYISPKTRKAMQAGVKKKRAVETPMFHQHIDTNQFKYYVDKIPNGALLSFHAKVHGTSARYSYSKVKRTYSPFVNLLEKATILLKKAKLRKWTQTEPFGKLIDKAVALDDKFNSYISKTTWEYLAGTRRVVLYSNDTEKEGWNGSEAWRFVYLEQLKPHLSKGMTVYGEIAGYANESPIMGTHSLKVLKDKRYTKKYGDDVTYKYGCVDGTSRFHIYRISYTLNDGSELDFTDAQIHQWCETHGFIAPVEIYPPTIYKGNKEELVELVEELTERPEQLTECYIDPSHISEGIVIRIDHKGTTPTFYKNKSYPFKVAEGIFREDNVDIEDAS